MSNDEFGTSNGLNFSIRTSAFPLPSGQVIDVFTAAGWPKPDISILSDQFLAEVRGLKHKNVAAELLEKLLKDERGKCRMAGTSKFALLHSHFPRP